MKMLVLPRDPNPYQGLLYGALGRLGVRIRYLGELTPSHTVNLLLLPAELAWHRMAGTRVVHLHWVFPFTLPGARRFPVLRRLGQAWFLLWLRACRALGLRLVWTAHNVLPHAPVFADDVAARRALVRASDLVLAHSAGGAGRTGRAGRGPAAERGYRAWPAARSPRPPRCASPARRADPAGSSSSAGLSSTKESPTCCRRSPGWPRRRPPN